MSGLSVIESRALTRELEILLQLLLLARGPGDQLCRRIDKALSSRNISEMREAKSAFDKLPEREKYGALLMDEDAETGSD